MSDYQKIFVLTYLYHKKSYYSISELRHLLGCSFENLEEILFSLKEDGMIEYDNLQLAVTGKGKCKLISNNILENSMKDDKYIMKHIDPEQAKRLDDIYIPDSFSQ